PLHKRFEHRVPVLGPQFLVGLRGGAQFARGQRRIAHITTVYRPRRTRAGPDAAYRMQTVLTPSQLRGKPAPPPISRHTGPNARQRQSPAVTVRHVSLPASALPRWQRGLTGQNFARVER